MDYISRHRTVKILFLTLLCCSIAFAQVFQITPKKIKKSNGTILTPEMSIIVTTKKSTSDPFYNGAMEIKEAYMRWYGFDYKKANCGKGDFNFSKLD
jgi:hypothetical protein